MSTPAGWRCDRCAYWRPLEPPPETLSGQCRRHAPRERAAWPGGSAWPGVIWPETPAGDWCGEFHDGPPRFRSVPPSPVEPPA